MKNQPQISVIIPVYREQKRVNDAIAHVRALDAADAAEIIVVDGEAHGPTIAVVDDPAVTCLAAAKGRALQMNAGAAAARGDTLLFLHVDTKLPAAALVRVLEVAGDSRHVGGAFRFSYDSERRILRIFSWLSTLRCRLTRLPFGDQGMFFDRDYFFSIGGFPEIPIMEDFELSRRVKRAGGRLRILNESARTSTRRLEREGFAYSAVRAALITALHVMGASPARLKQYYPDAAESADGETSQSPVSNRLRNRHTV